MASVIVDVVGNQSRSDHGDVNLDSAQAILQRLSHELAQCVGTVLNMDPSHVLVILLGDSTSTSYGAANHAEKKVPHADVKISAPSVDMLREQRHVLVKLVSEMLSVFAAIPASEISVRLTSGSHGIHSVE